jgi:hypothetical protein
LPIECSLFFSHLRFSKSTPIIALNSADWLVFVMEKYFVLCKGEGEFYIQCRWISVFITDWGGGGRGENLLFWRSANCARWFFLDRYDVSKVANWEAYAAEARSLAFVSRFLFRGLYYEEILVTLRELHFENFIIKLPSKYKIRQNSTQIQTFFSYVA